MRPSRRPPTAEIFKEHLPKKTGKCSWCGEVCARGRVWHDECRLDFRIIINPQYARDLVFERDKGICKDCGCDASRPFWRAHTAITEAGYDWFILERITGWHVDHNVPLWKVAHMPPAKRIDYYRLWNLKTRCSGCHIRKTGKENPERHHHDDLAEPKQKKPSRKLRSRGFDKAKTRRFDGNVVPKKKRPATRTGRFKL